MTMSIVVGEAWKHPRRPNKMATGTDPHVPGAPGSRPRPKQDVSNLFMVAEGYPNATLKSKTIAAIRHLNQPQTYFCPVSHSRVFRLFERRFIIIICNMETRRTISVYADTSVFGGAFDDEFRDASERLVEAITAGRFVLITSELVRQEIAAAPQTVRQLFEEMLPIADIAPVTAEAVELQRAYLGAGIVSERFATDALHVAVATVSGASMIVSWNFRHIVNFQKIPKYSAVNRLHGYQDIAIYSPLEVIGHEDEDV
jgi:predicted nucleic acid-binding protein